MAGGLSQATRGYLDDVVSGTSTAGALHIGTRGYLGTPIPGISGLGVSSVTSPSPNTIVVEWNQPVTLLLFGSIPSYYVVVSPSSTGTIPVTVTSVSVLDSTHLLLTTTNQDNGAVYQLNIPEGVVKIAGEVVNVYSSVSFTGNNAPLTVVSYHLVDATDFLVTYSRPVQPSTALILSNYVFSPALQILSISAITSTQYLIRTVRMSPNTTYTLTISNVLALDGASV